MHMLDTPVYFCVPWRERTTYKSKSAKAAVIALYDRQVKELNIPYGDIYVQTSFGRTHLIECGDSKKPPLLVFHGGNATSAYNLKYCDFCYRIFIYMQLTLSAIRVKVRKPLFLLLVRIMGNGLKR